MIDSKKTKKQLIEELEVLRQQVAGQKSEKEEVYKHLFTDMAQGVVYQDADGSITSANPAALSILWLTLEQMQGRTSFDPRWRAVREDNTDFPGEEHPATKALETGKPVHNVVMGVHSPLLDEFRWININAIPQFREGEDKAFRGFATFDDITDRKRTEEALLESMARYQGYFDLGLIGMAITSLEKGWVEFNDTLHNIFGYSREAFSKLTWTELT